MEGSKTYLFLQSLAFCIQKQWLLTPTWAMIICPKPCSSFWHLDEINSVFCDLGSVSSDYRAKLLQRFLETPSDVRKIKFRMSSGAEEVTLERKLTAQTTSPCGKKICPLNLAVQKATGGASCLAVFVGYAHVLRKKGLPVMISLYCWHTENKTMFNCSSTFLETATWKKNCLFQIIMKMYLSIANRPCGARKNNTCNGRGLWSGKEGQIAGLFPNISINSRGRREHAIPKNVIHLRLCMLMKEKGKVKRCVIHSL